MNKLDERYDLEFRKWFIVLFFFCIKEGFWELFVLFFSGYDVLLW